MHRPTAMTATAAALVAAPHATAPSERVGASRATPTATTSARPPVRPGVLAGQWDDWKCDDNNTLWVNR